MRFLSFHCDYFAYETTDRSRSKISEELTEDNKSGKLENVLVLLISVEKKDETRDELIEKSVKTIEEIIKQLKVNNIVLLSFAHLFGKLSTPKFALKSLKKLDARFSKKGFNVLRPPFGWFNELEFKAKGHPLSRISRKI
ncbi:MAG: hypothetical protein GF383_04425 [Candidatus Lokiarchaeota archaeon]|nr:hypothetical protein [Candidatus Lokiarchaeota archaeon]MBD3339035.1 hypothetical protein [Candidatus Lokiarchaeota archaeon]